MPMLTAVLDFRSSFIIAALFVTWVAVLLLALVVGNLHVRLQRLEQLSATPQEAMPYGHLLGSRLHDLLDSPVPAPGMIVFLSANCTSCKRVLDELGSLSRTVPFAIAWTDQMPTSLPALPPDTVILDEGAKVSTTLGIRVTPFVVVAGEDGRVVKAAPINSLSSLSDLAVGSADGLQARSSNGQVKGVSP
jgi:hypothetical protein